MKLLRDLRDFWKVIGVYLLEDAHNEFIRELVHLEDSEGSCLRI